MRRVAAAIILGALSSGCGAPPGATWSDISDFGPNETLDADDPATTIVFEDDTFIVAASSADDCVQVIAHGVSGPCTQTFDGSVSSLGGHSIGAYTSGTTRFVDLRTDPGIHSFVVWSNLSPNGRTIDAIRAPANSLLLWRMADGEAAWGVQMLAENGTLGGSISLVGLPAN